MGLLEDLLWGSRMDKGVEEFRSTPGAVLLDVRTRGEYADGHIPGSVNIPLDEIASAQKIVPGKDTPLFVHCLSGGRSGQAVRLLAQMGYDNARNIGGISSYHGEVER